MPFFPGAVVKQMKRGEQRVTDARASGGFDYGRAVLPDT